MIPLPWPSSMETEMDTELRKKHKRNFFQLMKNKKSKLGIKTCRKGDVLFLSEMGNLPAALCCHVKTLNQSGSVIRDSLQSEWAAFKSCAHLIPRGPRSNWCVLTPPFKSSEWTSTDKKAFFDVLLALFRRRPRAELYVWRENSN